MQVEMKDLSTPVKVMVTEEGEEIKKRKEKAYELVKDSLPELKGFRKGKIPREMAEKTFGVEKIYKSLLDSMVIEVIQEKNIIHTRDYEVIGDLSDNKRLRIEFVAEVQPTIKLPELSDIKVDIDTKTEPSKEQLEDVISKALKEEQKLIAIEKEKVENLDVAFIDYEGVLEGETEPFKGGSAKDYHLTVNTDKRSFIDTFEDQVIGMQKDETRKINVKFPDNYRDKAKSGKSATFTVTLKAIKEKVTPELDEEFSKTKGFNSVDEYKQFLQNRLTKDNERKISDNFKRAIVAQYLLLTEFSPIPVDMVKQDIERQWSAFLRRMGKDEKEFLKDNKNGKDEFFVNNYETSEQTIKTSLVLTAVSKQQNMSVTSEEVETYVTNIATVLKYPEEKIQKLIEDLRKEKSQFELQEKAALNEKVIDFLEKHYRENN